MAKSGFVPAWMKIPSADKTNGNSKLDFYRTNHSTLISTRQRHYSSDTVDHPTTRHSFYSYSKSNGQSKNKSNDSLSNKQTTNENFSSTNEMRHSLKTDVPIPETPEEKELLVRMGWNDGMSYEITEKDKEEYEKRLKLLPKTNNRSAKLLALKRRTLPCINMQDILQNEMFGSISDDDSSDE